MTLPSLEQIAPNVTAVEIGDNTFYFSYRTCVAVFVSGKGLKVSQNYWSVTTAKHLSKIDGGSLEAKKARLTADEFSTLIAGL